MSSKNRILEKKKQKFDREIDRNNSKHALWVSFFLLILVGLFISFCFSSNHVQDDSFISFRYVKNFINGHGLVFNPGERVEGYTSILWIFILSGLAYFNVDIISAAQFLGVISGAAVIVFTYLLVKRIIQESDLRNDKISSKEIFFRESLAIFPSILLTFNGAMHYWCISGMETGLFIFLSISGIYFYISNEKKNNLFISSILLMLNSLTRPEGILIFLIIALHLLINHSFKDAGNIFSLWKKLVFSKKYFLFFTIFLIPNLILLIFRLTYYGYPFPNTFYAKGGFSLTYLQTGLDYTWDFVKTYLLYGIIFCPLVYVSIKKKINTVIKLLLLIVLIYASYIITVGGDVLPIYRFFLVLLPLIFSLFSASLYLLFADGNFTKITSSLKSKLIIAIILILGLTSINYFLPKEKIKKFVFLEDQLVLKMTGTAYWLVNYQSMSSKNLVVAATTIGALSYYSDAIIIDMLGLTDTMIAHNPKPIPEISQTATGWKEKNYNADYIVARKPDFIYFSTGLKPSAYAERALFAKEEFLNHYFGRIFYPVLNLTDTIFELKSETNKTIPFVKFNANPNFSLDYIDLYVKTINMKSEFNRADEIFSNCEKLDKICPLNFSEPQRITSLTYGKIGQHEKALQWGKRALQKNKFDMLSHLLLFKYYLQQGLKDSIKWHQEMIIKYDPELLYHLQ